MNMHSFILCIAAIFACSTPLLSFSQVVPLYTENFDGDMPHPWQASAIAGTTLWQMGEPAGTSLDSTTSMPNAWVTNIQGSIAPNSETVLVSPAFDLSKPETIYYLGFFQKRSFNSGCHGYIDYSLDGGNSWQLLSPSGYPNPSSVQTSFQLNTTNPVHHPLQLP